jgi:hypothetical protein
VHKKPIPEQISEFLVETNPMNIPEKRIRAQNLGLKKFKPFSKSSITSIPNQHFPGQGQICNLSLKTKAISKGNFSLDYP